MANEFLEPFRLVDMNGPMRFVELAHGKEAVSRETLLECANLAAELARSPDGRFSRPQAVDKVLEERFGPEQHDGEGRHAAYRMCINKAFEERERLVKAFLDEELRPQIPQPLGVAA